MRISDWSSDVCSSDLGKLSEGPQRIREIGREALGWPPTQPLFRPVNQDQTTQHGALGIKASQENLVGPCGAGLERATRSSHRLQSQIVCASCRERVCQYV